MLQLTKMLRATNDQFSLEDENQNVFFSLFITFNEHSNTSKAFYSCRELNEVLQTLPFGMKTPPQERGEGNHERILFFWKLNDTFIV